MNGKDPPPEPTPQIGERGEQKLPVAPSESNQNPKGKSKLELSPQRRTKRKTNNEGKIKPPEKPVYDDFEEGLGFQSPSIKPNNDSINERHTSQPSSFSPALPNQVKRNFEVNQRKLVE